ncbi:hypothetical protein WOC76_04320 [Methylocystis sp. IM3]|uniref:hypothetical protein n=1 Tax=unclassified Methylocystis TaxID=2625913 RepID=UPI0030F5FA73
MITAEATLRSPAGFLLAIQAKAARLGWDHAQLLARANVSPEEWTALEEALSAASGETWRRLSNAVKSQACLSVQTSKVIEDATGCATDASYGSEWSSHFGDHG